MSDKKIDLDVEFAKLDGKKVGHPVPVQAEKEIDFSGIAGIRVVLPPPKRADAETKPAESVEKEDE